MIATDQLPSERFGRALGRRRRLNPSARNAAQIWPMVQARHYFAPDVGLNDGVDSAV